MPTDKVVIKCPCTEACQFEVEVDYKQQGGDSEFNMEIECECCTKLLEISMPGKPNASGNLRRGVD